MNSKEHHDFIVSILGDKYKTTAEDIIQTLTDDLILALYIPLKGERKKQLDRDRITHFKINDGEPINWGDLKCNEVNKFEDGTFLVVIDEAAPDQCPSFCEYIGSYLGSYGWEVRVQTEW